MATTSVKVEGLAEIEANLRSLDSKVLAKNVTKRALLLALRPTAEAARAKAPDDPETQGDDLKRSIVASDRLTKRQAGMARSASGGGPRMKANGFRSDPKTTVTVYAGPGSLPQAHMQELGTVNHGAQPFLRPAWDQTKGQILPALSQHFKAEIGKALARKAKKAARG